ncbi:BPSL0067 family protein, partial [Cronobacter sakazakii]|nr:BPSL0067 family protein [Cronobacter sakazakii]ELY6365590.1 BPSL0067 family protein [Cronobacter sakazakii]
TFDGNNHYGNHTDGRSHAAIYLGQDANGIQVLDQWIKHDGAGMSIPRPVSQLTIYFRHAPRAENNRDNYYVVE